MYSPAETKALRHVTFAVEKNSDKRSLNCPFPGESDSDSAISSISDEGGRNAEIRRFDDQAAVHTGTTGINQHCRELIMNTQHNQTSIPHVNPQFLRLPAVKEETIGTYYHPAHLRRAEFLQLHGNYYSNMIREQIGAVVGTEEEIHSFAKNWIHFRLQSLGQHQHSYQWRRVRTTYMYLLQNLTPKVARELQVISRFHSHPDHMFYLESQLSYSYDPSYSTVMGTSRNAYHNFQLQ